MIRLKTQIAAVALGYVLGLTLVGSLSAKSETVKITITGEGLSKPVEITDRSILASINIWSGPGNFKIDGGARIPIVHDGSILWSQGMVADPPKGLAKYEVSFYGTFPEERLMYVLVYEYDSTTMKGYVYLPGRGEKWYEVNVRSILRGVEGHWFHASRDFVDTIGPAIQKVRSAGKILSH
jgi:hypothetical protein